MTRVCVTESGNYRTYRPEKFHCSHCKALNDHPGFQKAQAAAAAAAAAAAEEPAAAAEPKEGEEGSTGADEEKQPEAAAKEPEVKEIKCVSCGMMTPVARSNFTHGLEHGWVATSRGVSSVVAKIQAPKKGGEGAGAAAAKPQEQEMSVVEPEAAEDEPEPMLR